MRRLMLVAFVALATLIPTIAAQEPTAAAPAAVADAPATWAGGLPSHTSDLPTYNGALAVGQWSDLYVANCHIKTQHGNWNGGFLRIWIVTTNGECTFEGGRLAFYTPLGGLQGLPSPVGTLCQLKIGNSGCGTILPGQGPLWDLFVGFPGSGLVGSEIAACGDQVLYTGYIAKVCGRWNLHP